jgi:hypothetical protein
MLPMYPLAHDLGVHVTRNDRSYHRDFGVHVRDPAVHITPIRAFTSARPWRSRERDFRNQPKPQKSPEGLGQELEVAVLALT